MDGTALLQLIRALNQRIMFLDLLLQLVYLVCNQRFRLLTLRMIGHQADD